MTCAQKCTKIKSKWSALKKDVSNTSSVQTVNDRENGRV